MSYDKSFNSNRNPNDPCCIDSFIEEEESNSSVSDNMDIKDFELPDVKERVLPVSCEKTDTTAFSVKEEMHSELNEECSPDRVDDALPQFSRKQGPECLSDSVTPFCFVGIKSEGPDGCESDTSRANSETDSFSEEYPIKRERECDVGVLASNGESSAKLNSVSCIDIKMESDKVIDSAISGLETNDDSSVSVDMNEKLDSSSVVHRYDMGHSSNEFIRGIECQQFPILHVKQEEKTDQQLGVNSLQPASNASCGLWRTVNHTEPEKNIAVSCGEAQESLNCTQYDPEIALKGTCSATLSRDRTTLGESQLSFEKGTPELLKPSFGDTPRKRTRVPTGAKPFACVFCRATFDRNGALVKHTRRHTGEKPFSCDRCDSRFSTKDGLVNHRRIHTGERPFQCPTCEVSFTRTSDLVKHTRIHTGEKPFKCVTCQVSFTQKSHLVIHARIHTGEKPFRCEICKSSFTSKHSLVNHTRIHTGETPFTCIVCKFSYSAKRNLVRHMRTHTGEKPFTCDICKESFRDKRQLVKHTRTHS